MHQYDKKEITDYLEACGTADHLHKDKLLALRLQLYEKICVIFTEYSEHEMYNRRIDRISEDIYIRGHSIVNERKDKRLCKVLKLIGLVPNSSQDSNHDQSFISIAEPVDFMETCLLLRDTVVNLTGAISTLKEEITVLREKVTLLEARLDNKRQETRMTKQQAPPMNKTNENVDTPQPHVPRNDLLMLRTHQTTTTKTMLLI